MWHFIYTKQQHAIVKLASHVLSVALESEWQFRGQRPNVLPFSLQPSIHQADNVRGTRHHGLVERPARNRFHPLHRRSGEKPGRQISFFTEESVSSEMLEKRTLRLCLTSVPSDLLRRSNRVAELQTWAGLQPGWGRPWEVFMRISGKFCWMEPRHKHVILACRVSSALSSEVSRVQLDWEST